MSATPYWQQFTPDDVQVMSLAFDQLCELAGIPHPSNKLAAQFAEVIVTVARSGDRDPVSLAASAMTVLGGWASYSQNKSRRLTPKHRDRSTAVMRSDGAKLKLVSRGR